MFLNKRVFCSCSLAVLSHDFHGVWLPRIPSVSLSVFNSVPCFHVGSGMLRFRCVSCCRDRAWICRRRSTVRGVIQSEWFNCCCCYPAAADLHGYKITHGWTHIARLEEVRASEVIWRFIDHPWTLMCFLFATYCINVLLCVQVSVFLPVWWIQSQRRRWSYKTGDLLLLPWGGLLWRTLYDDHEPSELIVSSLPDSFR